MIKNYLLSFVICHPTCVDFPAGTVCHGGRLPARVRVTTSGCRNSILKTARNSRHFYSISVRAIINLEAPLSAPLVCPAAHLFPNIVIPYVFSLLRRYAPFPLSSAMKSAQVFRHLMLAHTFLLLLLHTTSVAALVATASRESASASGVTTLRPTEV